MSFASDAQRRWFFANLDSGGSGDSGGGVTLSEISSRQLDRIAYAQAMYPHLSEPDALRQLNDREGYGGLK